VDRPLTRGQREMVGDADVRVVVAGEAEEFGA
jgi:hypothetical protein